MIDVLSPEGDAVVAGSARAGALIVLDFDGTLAPIVPHPGDAALRPGTRALLRAAALLFPTAIVSGRDREDVALRLGDARVVEVVGNHGAEDGRTDAAPRALARAWGAALEVALPRAAGVRIERKSTSIAIHHRGAALSRDEVGRIAQLAAALPGARVFGGKDVLNVVPADAPTKGDAVEALARALRPGAVLFVGDDVNDEDAFRSSAVTFSVRVGRSDQTAARWFVEDQALVDELLRRLVRARALHLGLGERWEALVSVLAL